ncbi:purine-nucleoside phosphorylase [soil metagenome]
MVKIAVAVNLYKGKQFLTLKSILGKTGIILGSGLNKFSSEVSDKEIIFQDDSGFHNRKIYTGNINDNPVVIFEGRQHIYEGNTVDTVCLNVEKAGELDVDLLIITNAAGGINPVYEVGDLMIMTSHMNLMFKRSDESYRPYKSQYLNIIRDICSDNTIPVRYGTYCGVTGPTYETNAEINFFRRAYADAIGMSTIHEIMRANNLGISTIGISCITNVLRYNNISKADHSEVVEAGKNSYTRFSLLLKTLINNSNLFID